MLFHKAIMKLSYGRRLSCYLESSIFPFTYWIILRKCCGTVKSRNKFAVEPQKFQVYSTTVGVRIKAWLVFHVAST